MGSEVVDWIHAVQNMDLWRVLVNTVMNLQSDYQPLKKDSAKWS
jgi:hypothetical protein